MTEIRPLQGHLVLGKSIDYIQTYTPSLLCSLSRSDGRAALGIENQALPFTGMDIWTAYELSWLDLSGKPVVACGIFRFPCQSPGMVESKSLKLYLNSFNQTRFASLQDVKKTLELDLSFSVQDSVTVDLYLAGDFARLSAPHMQLPGICIDELKVPVDCYSVNADLLDCMPQQSVQESIHSHFIRCKG